MFMKCTACGHRMAHKKWKETKQQPSMLPDPAVPSCSLVSFHFSCGPFYVRRLNVLTFGDMFMHCFTVTNPNLKHYFHSYLLVKNCPLTVRSLEAIRNKSPANRKSRLARLPAFLLLRQLRLSDIVVPEHESSIFRSFIQPCTERCKFVRAVC